MELWIRSQDKKRLLLINDELYILNSRTGEDFGIFYRETMLGHYKTEERVLEVLDEIQRLMIASLVDKNLDGYGVVIYEMPNE